MGMSMGATLITICQGVIEPRSVFVSESCPPAMSRVGAWRLEDFELQKQLYKGKASLLYKAICRLSGLPVALKLYRKQRLSALNWYQVCVNRRGLLSCQSVPLLIPCNILVLCTGAAGGQNTQPATA